MVLEVAVLEVEGEGSLGLPLLKQRSRSSADSVPVALTSTSGYPPENSLLNARSREGFRRNDVRSMSSNMTRHDGTYHGIVTSTTRRSKLPDTALCG